MGLNELLKSLSSEFENEKNEILNNAEKEAKAILEEGKKRISQQKDSEKKKISEEYELKKRRSLMALSSQIKLKRNRFKGELLGEFLKELEKEILTLGKKEYKDIYLKFLKQESFEDDMDVFIGSKEKNLDKKFVDNLSKDVKKKMNYKGNSKNFDYGIIFVGKTFEINLSFSELIKNIKDQYLLKISTELFNEK